MGPLGTIGTWPIDTPASARCGGPEQPLGRCAAGVVVEGGRTLVEASRMPGIRKLEMVKVEMMTVFVAKGAEKGSERSDVFLHRGTHPNPIAMVEGS